MKVNIDKTLEVTDEQRKQIAAVLDGKVSRRDATRDDMKQFIWDHGSSWAKDLASEFAALIGDPEPEDEGDLIGGDEPDGMDLI